MRVDAFDFELPEAAIALRPVVPRDAARLLVVRPGHDPLLKDRIVRELPVCLDPGDALIFNDTKVIPAELHGTRQRGASEIAVAFTLHKRESPSDWLAFARPGRRLKPGDQVRLGPDLSADVIEKDEGGLVRLTFDRQGPDLDGAILTVGAVPLPPYISGKRATDARDRADYQTIYAREEGAVAAPTAGLHFTEELFARLDARGIERHFVTLHVGAGTFLPVKADDTSEHRMHSEWADIDQKTADALNRVRARGNRLVSVGTTSLRLLESAAGPDGVIRPFCGDTDIFITPGYRFNGADALMTNFHLPRSTLMMLVAAFSGLETMKTAYAHAIAAGYRFYSYGDASLLFPEHPR